MINKNLTINTRPIKKNAKKYFYDQVGKLKKKICLGKYVKCMLKRSRENRKPGVRNTFPSKEWR